MTEKSNYIAIDYDCGYKFDPHFMAYSIQVLSESGHDVFFITQRTGFINDLSNRDLASIAKQYNIEAYFTQGYAKKKWTKLNLDRHVDIWVSGNIPSLYYDEQPNVCIAKDIRKDRFKLNVGMDFDGTYNADPHAFSEIVDYCLTRSSAYDCRIVTGRKGILNDKHNIDIKATVKSHNSKLKAIFTQLMAKTKYLDNLKHTEFQPHIWFDDEPAFIIRNR